jgi:hypothetical protein
MPATEHPCVSQTAFEQWERNQHLAEVSFGIINSGERLAQVGAFARRIGFACVGENFAKELG